MLLVPLTFLVVSSNILVLRNAIWTDNFTLFSCIDLYFNVGRGLAGCLVHYLDWKMWLLGVIAVVRSSEGVEQLNIEMMMMKMSEWANVLFTWYASFVSSVYLINLLLTGHDANMLCSYDGVVYYARTRVSWLWVKYERSQQPALFDVDSRSLH